MKRELFIIFWLAIFGLMSKSYADGKPPKDSLLGYHCYPSFRNPAKTTCDVSPIAVVSDPERFDGINIQTTGYLRRIEGRLVLFPSKDIYIFGAGRGGIELLGASSRIAYLLGKRDECTHAITVIGDFTYQTRGSVPGSIGVLHGDLAVFPQEMPGEAPRKEPNNNGKH